MIESITLGQWNLSLLSVITLENNSLRGDVSYYLQVISYWKHKKLITVKFQEVSNDLVSDSLNKWIILIVKKKGLLDSSCHSEVKADVDDFLFPLKPWPCLQTSSLSHYPPAGSLLWEKSSQLLHNAAYPVMQAQTNKNPKMKHRSWGLLVKSGVSSGWLSCLAELHHNNL